MINKLTRRGFLKRSTTLGSLAITLGQLHPEEELPVDNPDVSIETPSVIEKHEEVDNQKWNGGECHVDGQAFLFSWHFENETLPSPGESVWYKKDDEVTAFNYWDKMDISFVRESNYKGYDKLSTTQLADHPEPIGYCLRTISVKDEYDKIHDLVIVQMYIPQYRWTELQHSLEPFTIHLTR